MANMHKFYMFEAQATAEEIAESKGRGKRCTAAKAAPKPAAKAASVDASKRTKNQRPPAVVASNQSTPVKSPPKKKTTNTAKPVADDVSRRLKFKTPDPDQKKQIGALKEAPCCFLF